ncbi:MAG TPA: PASTA domain-containing protein [Caldithrix sp.]|nr:PASTA domain-containing protein [Caldithrix sp.]
MTEKSKSLFRRIFHRRLVIKLIIFFIGLILFTLLMDLVVMPFYTKHGKELELPDVTDVPKDEAFEILEAEGFRPILQDTVYNEQFAPGIIVQQNPLPFSRVKRGRRVYLVMSIGEKPRYVPKLIGLTPQDAEFRLREEGLRLKNKYYDFSPFYMKGVVINQSVPPGEIARKNQNINITISLGPAPTSQNIPNLVGKSLSSAQKELEAVGVRVGIVKYMYRSNLVPGTVLNQSVSAGQKAIMADSVNLIVSTDQPLEKDAKNENTK